MPLDDIAIYKYSPIHILFPNGDPSSLKVKYLLFKYYFVEWLGINSFDRIEIVDKNRRSNRKLILYWFIYRLEIILK